MHILIVEDEPELLEELVNVLHSEQYTTATASDGEEALDKIWNDTHDLILLDVMLPRLSGLDVLQELRKAGLVTPVLMLTAKGDVADKILGLNLGADDYLPKPFSLAELMARIRALLRRGTEANPIIKSGRISQARRKIIAGYRPTQTSSSANKYSFKPCDDK